MKTFKELFESTENEYVFSNPYRSVHDVPDDKQTYNPLVEKELAKLIKPITEAWNITINKIVPDYRGEIISKSVKIVSGELNVYIDFVNLMNNNTVVGRFFTLEDANVVLESFVETEIINVSGDKPKMSIDKKTFPSQLGLGHLRRLAKKKKIEIDLDKIKAFSQQCFYEEGPLWDAFKKEKRGSLAAHKFGQ